MSDAKKLSRALGGAVLATTIALAATSLGGSSARGDEGGVSFWLPGQYGSFAAVAPAPGFSLATVSYFYSASASASQPLERGGALDLGLDATLFGQFIAPSYAPDTTIFGAKPNFSLTFFPAATRATASAEQGPFSVARTSSLTGFSDLYPTAQLFWNSGVNNWMAYITGDIPAGAYSAGRLANIGIGHGAMDVGGAYTYLDPNTGWEFSVTSGLSFNFENAATNYINGVDAHLDWGASKFLSKQMFVGAVGYFYEQLTSDRGQPATLGAFESRTIGLGPQVGYNFDAGGVPIYTNLRGYFDLDTKARLSGGSAMLTLSVPISELLQRK